MEPMKPMRPMEPMKAVRRWWPEALGEAATSGGQDGLDYAVFPEGRRLAVRRNGRVTVYDTGDHRISGVAQENGDKGPAFSSQHGTVTLDELAPARERAA